MTRATAWGSHNRLTASENVAIFGVTFTDPYIHPSPDVYKVNNARLTTSLATSHPISLKLEGQAQLNSGAIE